MAFLLKLPECLSENNKIFILNLIRTVSHYYFSSRLKYKPNKYVLISEPLKRLLVTASSFCTKCTIITKNEFFLCQPYVSGEGVT